MKKVNLAQDGISAIKDMNAARLLLEGAYGQWLAIKMANPQTDTDRKVLELVRQIRSAEYIEATSRTLTKFCDVCRGYEKACRDSRDYLYMTINNLAGGKIPKRSEARAKAQILLNNAQMLYKELDQLKSTLSSSLPSLINKASQENTNLQTFYEKMLPQLEPALKEKTQDLKKVQDQLSQTFIENIRDFLPSLAGFKADEKITFGMNQRRSSGGSEKVVVPVTFTIVVGLVGIVSSTIVIGNALSNWNGLQKQAEALNREILLLSPAVVILRSCSAIMDQTATAVTTINKSYSSYVTYCQNINKRRQKYAKAFEDVIASSSWTRPAAYSDIANNIGDEIKQTNAIDVQESILFSELALNYISN